MRTRRMINENPGFASEAHHGRMGETRGSPPPLEKVRAREAASARGRPSPTRSMPRAAPGRLTKRFHLTNARRGQHDLHATGYRDPTECGSRETDSARRGGGSTRRRAAWWRATSVRHSVPAGRARRGRDLRRRAAIRRDRPRGGPAPACPACRLLDTPVEAAYVRGIDFGSALETCRVSACASREGEGNTPRGDR